MKQSGVLINEVGMMDSYQLTRLDTDPNYEQFQIVKIKNMDNMVVIGKSSGRRITEYLVCPVFMLKFHINEAGMKEFYKKIHRPKRGKYVNVTK
jgi:hypothetical protein